MKPTFITIAALALLLLFSSVSQALTIEADGPDQAPLIYVHGYIDDGTSWARDSLYEVEDKLAPMSAKYLRHYVFGPDRSPSTFFTRNGIENWAVQWWADDGFNTYSTAEEGFAFLQDSQQLLDGTNWVMGTWSAQNRPIPSALDILTAREIDMALGLSPIPSGVLGLPTSLLVKAGIASQLWIRGTYQDSGRVDPRAEDFLDMLRNERRQQGQLSRYRQVNLITHSMGSLVTRAMLDKAHQASEQDSEFVANVIYNAPPFGGSTMAYLAKLYFEPVQLNSSMFEDERVQIMLSTSATTAKDLMVNYLNLLIRPLGVSYGDIEQGFDAPTREAINLLTLIPINQIVDPNFIQSLNGTFTGDSIVAAMQFARPFVAGLLGVRGVPGHDDLTPEGGYAHITDYATNPEVKQFVTLGTRGLGLHLFPDDLSAVAADPSLITNNAVLAAQDDDTAVAEGSARLLTTTDNFGPRMDLLEEFELEHPDLLYRNLPEMGPVWLQTLLAPVSRMEVSGDIEVVDSAARSYLVTDSNASFSFDSDSITRTLDFPITEFLPFGSSVTINVFATSYEYRLVSDDGSEILLDWQSILPTTEVTFADLVANSNLEEQPFYIEWRSVNQRGGREMIRSARFVVAGDAPQLVDVDLLSANSEQVVKVARRQLRGSGALRGSSFQNLVTSTQLASLQAIESEPEANWVISQPNGKALVLVFDKAGDLEWAWNDVSLQAANNESGVSGSLIELAGLTEGVHTLYFRTRSSLSSQSSSAIQQVRIQVDDSAPLIDFELAENHPLGVVVGPATPLMFRVQDIGSNSATGELSVAANPDWVFPSDQIFTLQQTGLVEQMQTALIDAGEVTLQIIGADRVGNSQSDNHTVYFDITAPQVDLHQITPAVQQGEDSYQVFTDLVEIVVDISDAGSGIAESSPFAVIAGEREGFQFSEALQLGGVSGFPDQFGASLQIPMGVNELTIAIADFAGNTGSLSLRIERIEPVVQDAGLDVVSPRMDSNTCFNASGDVINCTLGAIDQFSTSYNGEVAAFSSSGNRFVRDDDNGSSDIFIWSGQSLSIASRNEDGELGNDDSQKPVLSGDGRYVLFESQATNLVDGAEDFNLFVKDLQTGAIAVVSRAPDGLPINLTLQGNFQASTTHSGRYVFFSSRNTTYLNEFLNPGTQVYMVDLDPDGNGNFFDDNYVTVPISNINDTTMPANTSEYPKVSLDGRYLVYNSRTDGSLRLVRFSGSDLDGDLDTSVRSETLIAGSGGSAFAINPNGDDVIFMTRENLLPADNNQNQVDADIYLSRGETTGSGFFSRSLELVSDAFDGSSSAMDAAFPIQDVSIALDKSLANPELKLAWVSSHTNMVDGDSNNTEDLFVERSSTVFPNGFSVPNWISGSLPSSAQVRTGGLSGDGRYAFWVSQQEYIAPYASNGAAHLFRRRIDPEQNTQLTVSVEGNGSVDVTPQGPELSSGLYQFDNEPWVELRAIPDAGFELQSWQGDVTNQQATPGIWMDQDRLVTAQFAAIPGPTSASALIETFSGQKSDGVSPDIVFDGDEVFSLSIVSQPSNGIATTVGGNLFYQPAAGFDGSDSFEFQVTNARGVSLPNPATAQVTVVKPNLPPTTAVLLIETTVNQTSDPELPVVDDPDSGDVFSYTLLADALNGTVSLQGNGFIYVPDADFAGEDSFSYRVTDSAGNTISLVARVTVSEASSQGSAENGGGSSGGGGAIGLLLIPLLLLRLWGVFGYKRG